MSDSIPLELPGLRVTLDKLVYRHLSPDETEGREHAFIYFLSIHNGSPGPVTIKGRKWVVTHDDGTQLVVEGDGVVGETPTILPGDKFSYNSWHALPTRTAVATGAFLGMDADGHGGVPRHGCRRAWGVRADPGVSADRAALRESADHSGSRMRALPKS